MSDLIKPGDLVMVVRPSECCGNYGDIGIIGTVSAIPNWVADMICRSCGTKTLNMTSHVVVMGGGVNICRLKKIDPPALSDDVERIRELEEV